MENLGIEFDGVFRFTNDTTEDFIGLWNNKEYVFPAKSCCPIIIQDETLEGIQSIRKKWAYKLAVHEFYKSKTYKTMSKMGRGLPPTFDEKLLEPMIESCLKPLPIAKAKVTKKEPKEKDSDFRVSKSIKGNEDLNITFKDDPIRELGKMPDTAI